MSRAGSIVCIRLFLLSVVILVASPGVSHGERPSFIHGDEKVLFATDAREGALTNRERCERVSLGGKGYLEIEEGSDPYSRVEWQFRFDASAQGAKNSGVLEIEFFDKGAGIIVPKFLSRTGAWVGAARHSSYTRLNTGSVRSAYFAFDLSSLAEGDEKETNLRVVGLQYLGAIRWHGPFREEDWAEIRESVPVHVRPMVTLTRPMELVTTAGVAVQGDTSTLASSLNNLHELAPLARVLGFTSIESYVTWNRIEPEMGRFDFTYYDAIVHKLQDYDLKWFPLLIVGSAYALPPWFLNGPENVGFVCLEHNVRNSIQSIWSPYHQGHVERVLAAFGKHYEPMNVLEGVRLGPSGNYGESQYPAGGNWPSSDKKAMHIHIGYWAGDEFARKDFGRYVAEKYVTVEALNRAWNSQHASFESVEVVLPHVISSRRQRLDTTAWYTDSMSKWCAWWAGVARGAMPNTVMYQSAGGWGFREAGTDYPAQTKAMAKLGGGIRLTNETDSFEQNFYATRLATTSARLYGSTIGFEPASSHTARGVVGRIFNTITTNGDHLFTYSGNIFNHQLSISKWLEHLHYLDNRQNPLIDVAIYYPETMNQLEDGAFRHLYGWGFNPRAREIRRQVDVDYLDETLIREGFLDAYKVLVFVWGNVVESDVQEKMDEWIRRGGVALYPSFPKGAQVTVEGDATVFKGWIGGDTGAGKFYRFHGDMEPPSLYGEWVGEKLRAMKTLHPLTRLALKVRHPEHVFSSVQEDGHLMVLNYSDTIAEVQLPGYFSERIGPYSISRILLEGGRAQVARGGL